MCSSSRPPRRSSSPSRWWWSDHGPEGRAHRRGVARDASRPSSTPFCAGRRPSARSPARTPTRRSPASTGARGAARSSFGRTRSSIRAPAGRASSSPRRWTRSKRGATRATAWCVRRSCARPAAGTSGMSSRTGRIRPGCVTASTPARWSSSRPRMGLLPAETRLGAIRLRAGDADRLRAFYEQTIGLECSATPTGVATLGAGGRPLVELLADPAAPPRPPGSTGLFHLALLVPTRADLARTLRRVADSRWPLSGASDHLVSEALYLADPEGNGIELYRDRPRDEWPRRPARSRWRRFRSTSRASSASPAASGAGHPDARGTTLGHVHLQVADLGRRGGLLGRRPGLRRHRPWLPRRPLRVGRRLPPPRRPEHVGRRRRAVAAIGLARGLVVRGGASGRGGSRGGSCEIAACRRCDGAGRNVLATIHRGTPSASARSRSSADPR